MMAVKVHRKSTTEIWRVRGMGIGRGIGTMRPRSSWPVMVPSVVDVCGNHVLLVLTWAALLSLGVLMTATPTQMSSMEIK